jgi:hypothetical protein
MWQRRRSSARVQAGFPDGRRRGMAAKNVARMPSFDRRERAREGGEPPDLAMALISDTQTVAIREITAFLPPRCSGTPTFVQPGVRSEID